MGDGTLYLDGNVSDKSDAKIRKVKLATVDQPTWSAAGVLTWKAVENAASYEVQLFKNNISVAVLQPTTLSTQNLLELMHDGGAGDYTATVKALAAVDGYYEDGDASDPSAVQEIVQLVANQPTLSNEGVAGWVRDKCRWLPPSSFTKTVTWWKRKQCQGLLTTFWKNA